MQWMATLGGAVLAGALAAGAAAPDAVPAGELNKYTLAHSAIFPGTTRDYWVYVPQQYNPAQPACLHVNQDGVQFNAPAVFDRLIASGAMPVTIGVFVRPGVAKSPTTQALDRFNRSFEYDGLGDGYARFLIEELLPEVERHTARDGRPLRFSHDGNDRSIAGSSSGAIGAFTAAWERPDAFRRVFSAIGTFVGLRGGNAYPTLIRKTEPKPLRVFLQDGSADLNIYGGDWWMANQEMERALRFAGYAVHHVWGDGGHNARQATEIFAEAMTWLWQDWPQPVVAGASSNATLHSLLIPGAGWQDVAGARGDITAVAANAQGEVFLGQADGRIAQLTAATRVSEVLQTAGRVQGLAFSPEGRLLVAVHATTDAVISRASDGQLRTLDTPGEGHGLVARQDGAWYLATTTAGSAGGSRVVFHPVEGSPQAFPTDLGAARGITLSPDQSLLYLGAADSPWVDSFQVLGNGTLTNRQHYYHLHVPANTAASGAGGMCVDGEGRLYVATAVGVQICDQAGRVNAILPVPGGTCASLCFGGEKFDTLYVASACKLYSRRLNTRGVQAFEPPGKPAPPRL